VEALLWERLAGLISEEAIYPQVVLRCVVLQVLLHRKDPEPVGPSREGFLSEEVAQRCRIARIDPLIGVDRDDPFRV
jgi:hypothetical protein